MFRMRFAPVVALVALLTLRTSPGLAQARAGDGPDASASTDGVSELDSDIAARDSTRAVLAEDEARIQVDQARLDSLQGALATARAATPPDTATMRRATAALKETKDTLNRDLNRSRRERARLAAIEKRLGRESDSERNRSTISALPSTAPSRETGRVASTP